jgi:hypothetical protein
MSTFICLMAASTRACTGVCRASVSTEDIHYKEHLHPSRCYQLWCCRDVFVSHHAPCPIPQTYVLFFVDHSGRSQGPSRIYQRRNWAAEHLGGVNNALWRKTPLTRSEAVSILPLCGLVLCRIYPGLFIYIDSWCVSIVMWVDAVDLTSQIIDVSVR